MEELPSHVDTTRPFLGLLSTRAQAEVAAFLLSNANDSFSISEIRRGTGLARTSVRDAVIALGKWGQVRIANPKQPRPRYASRPDSPITLALEMLTAAAADSIWPEEQEFERTVADVAASLGIATTQGFAETYQPLLVKQTAAEERTEAISVLFGEGEIGRITA